MKIKSLILATAALIAACPVAASAQEPAATNATAQTPEKEIRKVLFIGDSMTGWMAERLNAYGMKDGFEVATIVWDGSTIKKWASSPRLATIIKQQKPDAVFISLGMNELFTPNPEQSLGGYLKKIKEAIGNTPYLWIGPPSWPGHNKGAALNNWLEKELGSDHYFCSSALQLPRQSKTNPHPTKEGICKWMDDVVKWIPQHTSLDFPSLAEPAAGAMSRGKTFIYKRMKETL